jgi:O-antigen/teichoic acid export membrane protein
MVSYSGPLRQPALSALAKLATFPLVALAWLLAARLVVGAIDAEGYAAYMLVAGLAALLPFTDLGLGAAVMDAFSRRGAAGATDPREVLLTTWRTLLLVGLGVALLGAVLGYLGIWTVILGLPPSQTTNRAISVCVFLFGLGLPVSVGSRILTGLQLNHWAVGFQSLSAALMVVLVALISVFSPRIELFVLAPYISVVVANGLALLAGARRGGVRLAPIVARVFHRDNVGGAKVRHVAGPMFVISIVLPLAYQSDRIILSHLSGPTEVAEYSIVYQVFSPMMGVLGSAGVALWPVFAKDRTGAGGIRRANVLASEIAFVLTGFLMGMAIILASPYVARFVADEAITVSFGLSLAFAVLLCIQAASYPLAMVLTAPRELSIQAYLHVIMLAINLPASIFLTRSLGAIGPVIGSIAAICVALLIPQIVRVHRVTRSGPADDSTVGDAI